MKNGKTTFILADENGQNKEYEMLLTFKNEENGKNYIIYTDGTMDEYGNTRVFASIFVRDGKGYLDSIKSGREWEIIAAALERFNQENNG